MSKVLCVCVLGIVLLAVVSAVPGFAEEPTIFGPTGLIRVPGAYTVAPGGMQFSGHLTNDFKSLNMALGVVDRLELAAAWVDPDGGDSASLLSGKFRLFGEADQGFSLAAGIFDISDDFNRTAFVSAEKTFRLGDTTLLGIAGWGENNSLVDGLFAGAEVMLGRGYTLMVEYDGENVNGAVHAPVAPKFRVGAGFVDDDLYVTATYVLR